MGRRRRARSELTQATAPAVPSAVAQHALGRQPGSKTTVTSPRDAIRLEEVRRNRVFAGFIAVLVVIVGVALGALGGDPLAKQLHLIGLAVTFAAALWLLVRLRDPAGYQPWMAVAYGCGCMPALLTGYYYWGPHSAVILVIPIGAYFFALGESFYGALAILCIAVGAHIALAVASMAGWLADVGIVRPAVVRPLDLIGMLILVELVCVAAFVMARGLRSSTLDTMEQLDRAVRDVAQREALLDEAKQELDRALRVGGPGRHTGMTLGSFKLGHLLGRGAMGDVYEAIHEQTGEPAAIKLLHANAQAKPDTVARFLREVEIASRLRAANVVRVLEVPDARAPLPYLAMERLDGHSLADVLRDRAQMAPEDVTDLIVQLCRGIGAAHAAGIVHRDLKPRNVFRCQRVEGVPRWKVLDFGVSKLLDAGGTLTHGNVVGTPSYMSPEQARALEIDERADLYSLGVIAYRALTGRPAFSGTDIPMILHAVVYDMPPRPSEVAAVNPVYDEVLAVAIAKHPDDRFASADELARAFERAGEGLIDDGLRARAAEALRKHPWGSTLRR